MFDNCSGVNQLVSPRRHATLVDSKLFMPTYRAELHVHTVLSPCAGVEMIPPVIVEEALKRDINLIAITDHNATANIGAVMEAAKGTGLTVLPGMELQTREEVHVLCLFDGLDQAKAWQRIVDSKFPDLLNDEEKVGEQYVVDETGSFIRKEERMLISNIEISLEEAVEGVNRLGGIVIPAHVERRAYGLLAVLGFASPIFEALEVVKTLPLRILIDRASRLRHSLAFTTSILLINLR